MQTLQEGFRGFSVMMSINWDLLFSVFAICVALFTATFLGTYVLESMTHPVGY